MECKYIEELLSPYIEDELNSIEKQMVEEHLKSCQKCTDLFLSIKETTINLADFPEGKRTLQILALKDPSSRVRTHARSVLRQYKEDEGKGN